MVVRGKGYAYLISLCSLLRSFIVATVSIVFWIWLFWVHTIFETPCFRLLGGRDFL